MRFGRSAPRGFLPVFSVSDEEEAKALLVMACGRNLDGEFVAKELVEDQTLENLQAFGDRLKEMHDRYLKPGRRCRCKRP